MIGVVIGRFQVPELTPGHLAVLSRAANENDTLVVLLGVTSARGTQHDPLDYETRSVMIRMWHVSTYGTADKELIVLPLTDVPLDVEWVSTVDSLINGVAGSMRATIYGGSDSAQKVYQQYEGSHRWEQIPEVEPTRGTTVRAGVQKPLSSSDFRAGVIYASQKKWPTVYPTVDIVIYNNAKEILLVRRATETKWRFPGGFVNPIDHSLEYAADREAREETGLEIGQPVYVGSKFIPDWRYVNGPEAIITSVFVAQYIFGHSVTSQAVDDNLAGSRWVPHDQVRDLLVMEHTGIWTMADAHLDQMWVIAQIRELNAMEPEK